MSIRSVKTDFTSTSAWSSSSPLHPINMNIYHTQDTTTRPYHHPPGLGYALPAAAESSPSLPSGAPRASRRRSGGFTYPSGQSYNHTLASSRRGHVPPPPPANHSPIKFDPFACDDPPTSEPVYNHYWQYNSSTKGPMLVYKNKPSKSAVSPNVPYTIKLPNFSTVSLPATAPRSVAPTPAPPKVDRNARAKLVAGILLNRIYAVGKPMRRRFCNLGGAQKTYVKSGLSSVVSIEC
jgi:hypothetical protein